MDSSVTRNTDRNNIKPLLLGIAFVVMVLLCLFATRTQKGIWSGYFIEANSVTDSVSCLSFAFMQAPVSLSAHLTFLCLVIAFTGSFTLLTASVQFFGGLRVVALLVGFNASFTFTLVSILVARVIVKLRDWLKLFASVASFCYDWFRHGFFLIKKSCLEPSGSQPPYGSCYYDILARGVK